MLIVPQEQITTMLPWPTVDRFPNIGCIFGYQALLCINVLAIVFAMPYGSYRYVSIAGSRTLSGYLFMQVRALQRVGRGFGALGRVLGHPLLQPRHGPKRL